MSTTVTFYGSHACGASHDFDVPPDQFDFPTKKGMKEGPRGAFTRYTYSEPWSIFFGKVIMVPEGFKGKPPR
jgi:hypothetical protein